MKKLKKLFPTLLLMSAGAGVGFMAAKIGIEAARSAPTSLIVAIIVLFVPIFFLVIGVHEAGHAIAGTLVNFDFKMYVVGPFLWEKEEAGWKFKWNKNVNISGGLVICLPTSSEKLVQRFSVYALGGPIASLLFSGITYVASKMIALVAVADSYVWGMVSILMWLSSALSFIVFMMTILPMHSGGFYTDGARALRFTRGGEISRFELLLMKIITDSMGGIRPRLLNRAELNEALELGKKLNAPMALYIEYYLYQSAFDAGDLEEAEKHLKNYLDEIESIPKGFRSSVYLDAAFFHSFARKDLKAAEVYWKQYKPSAVIPKTQVLAVEATLLEKNEAEKRSKIDLALKELPNMLDRGVALALREKLMELKSSLK